jgi:bacterioferritin-associated ferredoxin
LHSGRGAPLKTLKRIKAISEANIVDNRSHLHLTVGYGAGLSFNPLKKTVMYVCICRQVTDKQIRELCRDGVNELRAVREKLGVASDCGKCGKLAASIIKEFTQNGGSFVNAA